VKRVVFSCVAHSVRREWGDEIEPHGVASLDEFLRPSHARDDGSS
jgi:hypothetical protein